MEINLEKFEQSTYELWEEHIIDMTDNITAHINQFCPVSENVLNAILAASKESYLAALKTLEATIISSLQE